VDSSESASGSIPARPNNCQRLTACIDIKSADRRIIGQDIATAEFGWPVGMPICRLLGRGLYDLRSDLASRRIARVVFCVTGGRLLLLHGFIKKTQKTPKVDVDLALKRMKEVTR
jgi:phage-related protein